MNSEHWETIKDLLDEVLKIEPARRIRFLEQAGIDGEIRDEIESLLAFEGQSRDFMSLDLDEFSKDFVADESAEISLIGQKIGIYEIIRELGIGGMGAVYLAERTDEKFAQKVAVKMLKRELNVGKIRKNFRREREILSKLNHPNIATLLDAGTTADGVPYLVMEYVEGLPIDVFCNKNNLDLNKRLDLFRKVCAAVNFAHRNLIVHRDLKPSNILVNEEGVPKLLDFGISKILSAEFDQVTSATVTRLGVMTPSYASPEQLQNKSVTTATDIYSLGVILYELLSGHRPFEMKEEDLKEIYKAVVETEPKPPSSVILDFGFRISDLKKRTVQPTQQTKKQKFQTNPQSAIPNPKSLSGDLDNIVLKALRKEPERRYSSAENLAEDIHRHQRGLPVTARPQTFAYRTEKFFKRNKAGVIGGFLLILAIVGGIIATLWQAKIANEERDRARLEAEKAEKINVFLQNVLNLSNPFWISANPDSNVDVTVVQALDEAAQKVETDLAGQTEIQAEIYYTLGKTYMGQGKLEKARIQLEKSLEKFSQIAPENSSKMMQVRLILGELISYKGTESDTEQMFAEIVAYFRENLEKNQENRKWLALALSDLAISVARKGKTSESEEFFRQCLEHGSTLNGQDRWIYIQAMGDLGDILVAKGKMEEAIGLYQSAIEEGRKLTDKPRPEIATSYYDLGRVYKRLGNYPEAWTNIQKAYEIFKKTLGEETIQTSMTRRQIAELHFLQGEYGKARAEIEESLKVINIVVPEKPNLYILSAEDVLANILLKTGDAERAEKIMREVTASYPKVLEPPHFDIATAKKTLGEILIAKKRFDEARQFLTDSEKEFFATIGENAPQTRECRELLGKIPK